MSGASVVRVAAGVVRAGGVTTGVPSPTGEWDPSLDAQYVDFDRDKFTRFIADKGYKLMWEKAVMCPNVPGTGLSPRDHVIGCPICGGGGFVYTNPCETAMLMQAIKFQQSFYAYGRWDIGNQVVTAEPGFLLNYFDRLTLVNGISRFTQRVVRQPGVTNDVFKYGPLCVDYVGWVDRTGTLVSFEQDIDFTITDAGISWVGASQPDAGSVYSVDYTYHPRYVVMDLIHHHRDSTVDGKHYMFPMQAVAKLDFLVRNEGADAPQTVDQDPFKQ